MCFAVPFKVVGIEKNEAVDCRGKRVKLDLVGRCRPGQYLLVQSNIAVEKIGAARARMILRRLKKSV